MLRKNIIKKLTFSQVLWGKMAERRGKLIIPLPEGNPQKDH